MLKVETIVRTEYRFSDEIEEEIKRYARENDLTLEDAIYDLIDQGKLDFELDSSYEKSDNPEILSVFWKSCLKRLTTAQKSSII